MRVDAAIVETAGEPLVLGHVELDEPRDDEVLVRMTHSGVCHTDIGRARVPNIGPMPCVLGHEGAGVVERIGSAVRTLKPGDHVVLSFDSCGRCDRCFDGKPGYCRSFRALNMAGTRSDGQSAMSRAGTPVYGHFFGQSSFASYSVVHERGAVVVDPELPLGILAPLGCGVQTGAGTVFNVMHPHAGDSLAVFGVGSVGLSAIMAAAVTGCATIIAIDRVPSRLELALELGATHTLLAVSDSLAGPIKAIAPWGVNFAFDTTGAAQAQADSIACLDELGLAVTVSLQRAAPELLAVLPLLGRGRAFRGSIEGDAVPQRFIPQAIDLWRAGRFPIDRLVTAFPFDQINEAFAASSRGDVIKPVLEFAPA